MSSMYDAVNNIDGRFSPYLVRLSNISRNASEPAAADQTAHDVLVALYPAFQSNLDEQLQQDLAQIAEGQDKTDGIAVGETVAAQILAFRKEDGANVTPPPFKAGTDAGEYQLTPPNFAPADFTQWPTVTPFALARADEFRPSPPPRLTSDAYARAFNEVKSLGIVNSTTRTPEQTLIGKFWNGNIQDFWNEIAQTAAVGHHLNLPQSARLFALLNISLADTTISLFEAKYTYVLAPGDCDSTGERRRRFQNEARFELAAAVNQNCSGPFLPGRSQCDQFCRRRSVEGLLRRSVRF